MNLNPFRRERKSFDVMPEGLWQQMVAAQDMYGSMGFSTAVGLPAVLSVIRLISHAVAMVPLQVRHDSADPVKALAIDTWQWRLLQKRPGAAPLTPFNFKADVAAQFCGRGNAYVRKLKPNSPARRLTTGQTPRITELMPLLGNVKPRRSDQGAVVFDDATGPKLIERGTDEVIQVRSFSVEADGLTGLSPISAARMLVSAGLKRQQFEDRHLSNGIFPGIAVEFARGMDEEQASRWLDFIEARHRGSGKAGKAIGVPYGANLTTLPISLEDALFAEMTRTTMEQAAAMYQVPQALVNKMNRPVADDDWRHFMAFAVGPVLTAICESFSADQDFISDDEDLTVVADTDAIAVIDPLKKAQVQREQIQTGARLVDELRAGDGLDALPPLPEDWTQEPGKVPQITPVGGAPNPEVDTTTPAPEPAQEGE